MKPEDCYNISDLRAAARRRAHRMMFDYIDGGSDDEKSLARSVDAFDDVPLVHRVLTGVDSVDMSTTVLGQTIDVPFFCSATAGSRLFHDAGESAVAKAAADMGTIYGLSTLASTSIETIGVLTSGPKWFQIYAWKDKGLLREMMARARAAGFNAIALTVDLPVHGNRERDYRNGFSIPPKIGPKQLWHAMNAPAWSWDYLTKPDITYANLNQKTPAMSLNDFVAAQLDADFSWKDAEALVADWGGPAAIKGVMHPHDARKAVDIGFQGVVVSNHGGRQLDGEIAPIEALPDIVEAVGSEADVILDGGIRRGTHIIKALSRGAKAVSIGRPYLYGLAAFGAPGVTRALSILRDEVRRDMQLMGVNAIDQLT